MTIEEALRDAIVTAELELRAAIRKALPDDPDLDQLVQWWGGHIATWRAALGDAPEDIARDYETAVAEVSAEDPVAMAEVRARVRAHERRAM
jgi:hypothetical protein